MPDSQTAPNPDRAMLILANAVAEIVGSGSPVFQHIVLAAGSHARSDHARARETFDNLPGAQRLAVKGKAETTATAIRQQMVCAACSRTCRAGGRNAPSGSGRSARGRPIRRIAVRAVFAADDSIGQKKRRGPMGPFKSSRRKLSVSVRGLCQGLQSFPDSPGAC